MEYERQRAYDILLGEERGASKKADEDAVAFLKEGLSVETIPRCIGISLEHVKELAAQLGK